MIKIRYKIKVRFRDRVRVKDRARDGVLFRVRVWFCLSIQVWVTSRNTFSVWFGPLGILIRVKDRVRVRGKSLERFPPHCNDEGNCTINLISPSNPYFILHNPSLTLLHCNLTHNPNPTLSVNVILSTKC